MLDEIFRNRKIFNKYIKNFDLDAVELVGTGMTSVEALKAVVKDGRLLFYASILRLND